MRQRPLMWACSNRGDCCEHADVTMTREEQAIVQSRANGRILAWVPAPQGLVTLLGQPCPFHVGHRCEIHEVRPYNCRRYMCGRDGDEPYDPAPIPQKVIGLRQLRRQYAMNQKKAQKWARAHGWHEGS